MFSQYSWWDFAKFCLALAIPYYAYVIWTYYRHDIREWIANRGTKETTTLPAEEADAENDDAMYSVSNYVDQGKAQPATTQTRPADPAPAPAPPKAKEKAVATAWLPEPPANTSITTPPATVAPVATVDREELEINAPQINTDDQYAFGLSLDIETQNPGEHSLDSILLLAQRIKPGTDGLVEAVDENDAPAKSLAAQINSQQDMEDFAGLRFTR